MVLSSKNLPQDFQRFYLSDVFRMQLIIHNKSVEQLTAVGICKSMSLLLRASYVMKFTAEFRFYLVDVVLRILEVAVQKIEAASFRISVEVRIKS